jgi:hypothetical protein
VADWNELSNADRLFVQQGFVLARMARNRIKRLKDLLGTDEWAGDVDWMEEMIRIEKSLLRDYEKLFKDFGFKYSDLSDGKYFTV